ncbi:MAG: Polyamine aminopropyltransferase [Candidatus Brocadiaceae bacterium]|nr:Polyamine aminopropyltransferase [Candidatus Brocadiaceae bacterium]
MRRFPAGSACPTWKLHRRYDLNGFHGNIPITMLNKTVPFKIALCIAAIGCYSTIAQVMMMREFLNVFYGSELCLGAIFGAWFLGIAIGAYAGARMKRATRHAGAVFVIVLLVMCLVLPAQVFLARCARGFFGVGIGEYVSILPLLFTSAGMLFPFSFLIGFIFPFSSKIISSDGDAAVDVGLVYIIESLGSLAGGLVFSFFLVSRFHPFEIITLLNINIFILLAFLLLPSFNGKYGYFSGEGRHVPNILGWISLGLASTLAATWLFAIPDKIEGWSTKIRWNTLSPHVELAASADSKYQHIDVGKQAGQYNVYLNGQYSIAFPNEYEYAQIAHLVMTQHPSPKQVLLIGNGLGGILSEMLLYPIDALDYVELDHALLQLCGNYLSTQDKQSLADKRVKIFYQDGRYYVKNVAKDRQYDIVLVNAPDPSTAFLNRFYTKEFFREIQGVLRPGGIVATSVSSAVTYIGKDVGSYTGSLYRTLHETFPHVLVTPGQTNFYFASNKDGVITLNVETLMERYRKSRVASAYFTEHLFYTLLQPEQAAFIEKQLSQRKDLIVNTDTMPVTYFLNLIIYDALTGGRFNNLFHRLQDAGFTWFLLTVAFALAGRILYLFIRQRIHRYCIASNKNDSAYSTNQIKTNCLIALAITGFTGIALEILLLFAFQNIYGYLYERMGVIVAVFMVGLALGGYVANRKIQKGRASWIPILAIMEGVIGCYALALPWVIHALSSHSITAGAGLICLTGITGTLTGIEFPLVNKIFMHHRKDIALSAGVTNGADHAGAFLGAILTGVILLPLLGMAKTCIILAVLNFACMALIIFSRRLAKDTG